MCGIVGYIGARGAAQVLIPSLKRLEYRGYDSAGLAVINGGSLSIRKAQGKIALLETDLRSSPRQWNGGYRPHPLGNARGAFGCERASAR